MRITLIGAGNVGVHLGKRLYKKKVKIHQVFSRTLENAKYLGDQINAAYTNQLEEIDGLADIYILAIKDDLIGRVGEQLAKNKTVQKKLVVHTSGAVESTVLAPYFKHYGVFYPLQTFSKNKKVAFKNIPICVDAEKRKDKKRLLFLANQISKKVYTISDQERAILHVAAVFVNNFTNHLFYIASDICTKEQIDFNILQPLIQETVLKIQDQAPLEMQTGPARRGDKATIKKHLLFLRQYPEYAILYSGLSESIQNLYITVQNRAQRSENR